jgi:hypothetical protein
MSQREASQHWGVPKSTLQGRIHGCQDRQTAHMHQQLLAPAQENEIVAWCSEMEQRFLPVRLTHLRDYAKAILQEQAEPNSDIILGEHWEDRF